MRVALMLCLLLAAAPAVHAETTSSLAATGPTVPAEAWTPLRIFVGTWAGDLTSGQGPTKVRREYVPVLNNQHLQVTEEARGADSQPWGLISYDAGRHSFVLRHFSTDGTAMDLPLDPAATSDKELVFASGADATPHLRVTYRIVSWNEFVERIESAATQDQAFTAVAETHFKRKH